MLDIDHDHRGLAAITSRLDAGLPHSRMTPEAAAAALLDSDRQTEEALLERERAGTLTPGQVEVLHEIRARRSAATGVSPPAAPSPPMTAARPNSQTVTIAAPVPKPKVNTVDGWKAEYAASAALHEEFGSEDKYIVYQRGVADGRIRIARNRRSA